MSRYIDTEPLEKLGYLALAKVIDNYRFAYSPLCEIPRADVAEVVHAYPIFDKKHNEAMCSNCKSYTIEYDVDNWDNYCSHCGAKMDGKKDER